jgi:four helix bundle protein
MSNIENLKVWNDAIELSVNVYKLMASDNKLNNDYGLKDQIQRASVSIASNIAE